MGRHSRPSAVQPGLLTSLGGSGRRGPDTVSGMLHISEPWEFGTAYGDSPIKVTLTVLDASVVLVHLPAVLELFGVSFRYLLGQPRYVGDQVGRLAPSRRITLDLIPLASEPSTSEDAVAMASRWRAWHLTGEAWRDRER